MAEIKDLVFIFRSLFILDEVCFFFGTKRLGKLLISYSGSVTSPHIPAVVMKCLLSQYKFSPVHVFLKEEMIIFL